jgi:thiamine-monophosphate kinase
LIGGDTTKGPLNITITMMGVVENSRALLRSGAGIGDGVYVSGTIGDAALCLKKLREGLVPSKEELLKLNRPNPRMELGMGLKGVASSCIDISDGLEQDLSHILIASNVGAVIDVNKLPLSKFVLGYIKNNEDWSIPLCGGDDYELCFTVPESNKKALNALSQSCDIDITKIGDINGSRKLKIEGYDGTRRSYQHF